MQMLDVRIRDDICLEAACIKSFFFYCNVKTRKLSCHMQLLAGHHSCGGM